VRRDDVVVGQAVHPPVSAHRAVVAVPLAAHGAPYSPSAAEPLRLEFADLRRRRRRLRGRHLDDVPALHVVDERPHVALVRVTHSAHGGPGLGVRRVHVLGVR